MLDGDLLLDAGGAAAAGEESEVGSLSASDDHAEEMVNLVQDALVGEAGYERVWNDRVKSLDLVSAAVHLVAARGAVSWSPSDEGL